MKYILLDFDSTITTRDTTRYLIRELLRPRPWRFVYVIRLVMKARLGLSGERLQIEKNRCIGALIKGLGVDDVSAIVRRFQSQVDGLFRKQVLELIETSLDAGKHLIIVSASPLFALSGLFQSQQISIIATKFQEECSRYTGELVGECCYGSAKVEAIEKAIGRNLGPCEIESAWSDSLSDLPMMQLAAERYWICNKSDAVAIRSADPRGIIILAADTL